MAIFGAWLAALSGAWFVLGGQLSALWHTGGSAGQPVGDNLHRVVEQIGFFTGLGLVIVFLAAVALGRFTVIGHRERALAGAPAAERVPAEETTRPVRTPARVPDAEDTPRSRPPRWRPPPRPTPKWRRRGSPVPPTPPYVPVMCRAAPTRPGG